MTELIIDMQIDPAGSAIRNSIDLLQQVRLPEKYLQLGGKSLRLCPRIFRTGKNLPGTFYKPIDTGSHGRIPI